MFTNGNVLTLTGSQNTAKPPQYQLVLTLSGTLTGFQNTAKLPHYQLVLTLTETLSGLKGVKSFPIENYSKKIYH